MNKPPNHNASPSQVEQEAAAWVLRIDRGLTPAEQDAFSEWLAGDPRRGAQFAGHRRHWNRLDTLAQWLPEHSAQPNPDLLAPALPLRLRRFLPLALTFAAAAAIAVLLIVWKPNGTTATLARTPPVTGNTPPTPSGPRILEDGTVVELNRDAVIAVTFAAAERRVRLERGEAHFAVTKDPARPFIVNAAGIEVRAIGTAFNVSIDAAVVEVLVTEGKVQLDSVGGPLNNPAQMEAEQAPGPQSTNPSAPTGGSPTAKLAVLEARQRAVVSLGTAPQPPQIDTLTPGEIERVLAWKHRLLNFTATPLREIVAEFNRRNVVQLVVVDPDLASVRISAAFRSDNIEGFVSLLEAGFGARAERRGATEILLFKVYPLWAAPDPTRVLAPQKPD